MKRMLLLLVSGLLISNVAMADHIGIYADASGTSCTLVSGFNPNVTIIHKFTYGATGSRFRVDFGGNGFFAFNSPFVTVGSLDHDLSVGYGQCLNGCIPLGQIVTNLTILGSSVRVVPAEVFPNIIYTDCSFGEYPATGGIAHVGYDNGDCAGNPCTVPVEPTTWGSVKALYR